MVLLQMSKIFESELLYSSTFGATQFVSEVSDMIEHHVQQQPYETKAKGKVLATLQYSRKVCDCISDTGTFLHATPPIDIPFHPLHPPKEAPFDLRYVSSWV